MKKTYEYYDKPTILSFSTSLGSEILNICWTLNVEYRKLRSMKGLVFRPSMLRNIVKENMDFG